MTKKIYLIAEAGEPKRILGGWREKFFDAEKKLSDYCAEIGATGVFRMSFEAPTGFQFPHDGQPEGWTKTGKNGSSCPKKSNREAIDRIKDLYDLELLDQLVTQEFNLPTGCAVKTDTSEMCRKLTSDRWRSYSACWTVQPDGTPADVILVVQDFQELRDQFDQDEIRWNPEGTSVVIPDGFRKVSEAEVDLIFSDARVKREAYKAERKPGAPH